MKTLVRSSMGKQVYRPNNSIVSDDDLIRNMGINGSEGTHYVLGKDWYRHQVCRQDTFSLVVLESFRTGTDWIGQTCQQDYVKFNFWLSGSHSTILDGYGQYAHSRPEVFITSGPWDMVKVDVLNQDTQTACVALCVLREFFPRHLGLDSEELPQPLRQIVTPDEKPYAFHRFPLTPDLMAATRAILAAPFPVRQQPIYVLAKAVELMCLLINLVKVDDQIPQMRRRSNLRRDSRLHEAREMIMRRYADAITLDQIAKDVCLNRMALTSGFRELFGTSVYDFLQKVRMERAYDLLQEPEYSIANVAEAVGYGHSCNFSTAFHSYFGCTPQNARRKTP
jgi:AraC-like DNA-binding protein